MDSEASCSSVMYSSSSETTTTERKHSLDQLPPHILTKIIQKLPNKSRVYLKRTNRRINHFIEVNRNVIAAVPLGEPLCLELTIYEIPRPPEKDCVRYRVTKSHKGERINISSPEQISALSIDSISITSTTEGDLTVQMGYAREFLSYVNQRVRKITFFRTMPEVILEMMSYLNSNTIAIYDVYGGCRNLIANPIVQRCISVSVPLLNEEFVDEQDFILDSFKSYQEVSLNWCTVEFAYYVVWQIAMLENLGNLRRVTVPCTWFFSSREYQTPANTRIWSSSESPFDVYKNIHLVETATHYILYCEGRIDNISPTYIITIYIVENTVNSLLKCLSVVVLPQTCVDLSNIMPDIEEADSLDTIGDLFYSAYLDWIPQLQKAKSR